MTALSSWAYRPRSGGKTWGKPGKIWADEADRLCKTWSGKADRPGVADCAAADRPWALDMADRPCSWGPWGKSGGTGVKGGAAETEGGGGMSGEGEALAWSFMR